MLDTYVLETFHLKIFLKTGAVEEPLKQMVKHIWELAVRKLRESGR